MKVSAFILKTNGNLVMKTFVGSEEKLNYVNYSIYIRTFLDCFLENFIEKNL